MNKQDILNALKVMRSLQHTVCLDDLTNCKFYLSDSDVCWVENSENYSAEIQNITREVDLIIITIDNGCGETVTCFFDADNELSEEEFYEV